MTGILDSKSRVMDTILTTTGKDQAARGELDVKFASISDRQINYTTGSLGIFDDVTNRIYFESYSDDNDTVVYEIDALGALQPFVSDDYMIYGGLPFDVTASQGTIDVGGKFGKTLNTPGSIDLVSDQIIDGSTNNFKRLMLVGSRQVEKYDKNIPFEIDLNKINFEISNSSPIDVKNDQAVLNVDQTESVFLDKKFGNFINYKFLPPVIKDYEGSDLSKSLGEYSNINQASFESYDDVKQYLSGKKFKEINFTTTSINNNILGQFFSVNVVNNQLEKLAIIDVGEFSVKNKNNPHLFFAGKIYRDSVGSLTFVNIFTIVLE